MSKKNIESYLLLGLFAVFIVISTILSFSKPIYDWDMLAYAGLIYKTEGLNDNKIHSKIYKELLPSLNDETQSFLINNQYEKNCATDFKFYISQLPLYSIKPSYNFLACGFYQLTKDVIISLQIISVISFLGICFVVFFFLYNYMNLRWSVLCSILVLSIPIVKDIGRTLTPDSISTFFILTSLYFYLIKKKTKLSYLLLFISISIRPDNILYIILFIAYDYIISIRSRKIFNIESIGIIICSLILYQFIISYFNGYGWKITFQHSMIDLAIPMNDWNNVKLSISNYFNILLIQIIREYPKLIFAIIFFLTTYILLFYNRKYLIKYVDVFTIIITVLIIKYLLFPSFSERYNMLQFIIACIVICISIFPTHKIYPTDSNNFSIAA